jgi:hypothetical protein
MKTQDSAALFKSLAALCRKYPQWRFGQLIANVSGWAEVDLWDVEDDQLLEAARLHLEISCQSSDDSRSSPRSS